VSLTSGFTSDCGLLCDDSITVSSFSLLWGLLASGKKGYAALSIGPSSTTATYTSDRYQKGIERKRHQDNVYGLTIQSQLFLKPWKVFGLGVVIDANLNESKSAAALIIALQTGSP
jgi:hypothetical protein